MVPHKYVPFNVSIKNNNKLERATKMYSTVESCHSEKPTLGEGSRGGREAAGLGWRLGQHQRRGEGTPGVCFRMALGREDGRSSSGTSSS